MLAAISSHNVPGRINVDSKITTVVSLNWDPSLTARDRQAGFTSVPARAGNAAIVAAWAGTDFARDKVITNLAKADRYERAMATEFAEAVAYNESALAELKSNYPMGAKYQPKNGTFDFILDRPGNDFDLRYVGVIDAAPAPIRAILHAAKGFRQHFAH